MKNLSMKIIKICFLTLAFIASPIQAQSLDSLINEAVTNNPMLKSLQHRISASEYKSESVNYLPAPNLSVEFSQIPIDKYDIYNKTLSNSIGISQMFPLGGKLNAMSEVEKQNTAIEGNNYESYKVSLIAQVKMSYYSIWLIDRKIEVQERNISLLNDFSKAIEVSYYTNKTNQADILTIQSEVASNETQLLILKNQKEAEVYKINKLLGRDLNSKSIYVDEQLDSDSLALNQNYLEEVLAESNPSLMKMNNMIEMNKAMITSNNKELIPDLMVKGMLMRMPRGMVLTSQSDLTMLDPQTKYMYSLMFSITLPFVPWSSGKIKNKEEELASGINSIEEEKNDMQRDLLAKLKEALVKYKTANELTSLYTKKVIPLYKNSAESQSSAYQNGKTGITTVIDSYRMLLMQQMNYYMAKADVQMSLAEIEMMIGSLLNNNLTSKGVN